MDNGFPIPQPEKPFPIRLAVGIRSWSFLSKQRPASDGLSLLSCHPSGGRSFSRHTHLKRVCRETEILWSGFFPREPRRERDGIAPRKPYRLQQAECDCAPENCDQRLEH